MIDRVGLLKREHATERGVTLAYRHYRHDSHPAASAAFSHRFCHLHAPIQMVGVFDTVKALGLRLPLLWMLTEQQHQFHNHRLGASIQHGFHALALHETRAVFEPVLWECPPGWQGNVQQMWFRGAHGDVGGMIGDDPTARPLANIPLVWMLERAEQAGLALPEEWRARYPCDPKAPMVGTMRGWGDVVFAAPQADGGARCVRAYCIPRCSRAGGRGGCSGRCRAGARWGLFLAGLIK